MIELMPIMLLINTSAPPQWLFKNKNLFILQTVSSLCWLPITFKLKAKMFNLATKSSGNPCLPFKCISNLALLSGRWAFSTDLKGPKFVTLQELLSEYSYCHQITHLFLSRGPQGSCPNSFIFSLFLQTPSYDK